MFKSHIKDLRDRLAAKEIALDRLRKKLTEMDTRLISVQTDANIAVKVCHLLNSNMTNIFRTESENGNPKTRR